MGGSSRSPWEKYAGYDWDRADITQAPAGTAHLEFLRRPTASPPLCGYVPPAALDDRETLAQNSSSIASPSGHAP
jgi:hypothetical protein